MIAPLSRALARLAASPRALLLVLLLTVLAYLPGVNAGFMADDHFFAFVYGELPAAHPFNNLFALVDTREEVRVFRDHGVLPWWAADDMRIVFWRPLPSFTHWLDARLFGESAAPMHLVSLAWYLATVALVWRVYARFFPAGSWALPLAVAVFALDDAHVVNVQWIASRNDLIGGTFLLVAVLGLFRLREGRPGGVALLLAGFVAALLSKESSVVFPGIVTAHVLFVPGAGSATGSATGPSEGALARLRAHAGLLAVVWAIALGYLFLYFRAGFGPNTLYYLNPARAPELWSAALVTTGAAHLSILATGIPLHTLVPDPVRVLPAVVALCGGVTLATVVLGWRLLRADRAAWFFAAWTLGGLALVTTSFPDPRLLFVASIGSSFLVGRLAEALWTTRAAWRRPALVALGALHLGLAPAVVQVSLGVVGTFRGGQDKLVAALRDAVDYDRLADTPVQVFFLNWHQRETSPLATLQLIRALPRGAELAPLLTAPGVPYATRVERAFQATRVSYHALSTLPAIAAHPVADDALVLTAPDGDFFPTVFERLFLTSAEARVGTTVDLPAFSATIETVEHGRVTRVRFTFPQPLASPDYRFLAFRDGAWSVARFDAIASAGGPTSQARVP